MTDKTGVKECSGSLRNLIDQKLYEVSASATKKQVAQRRHQEFILVEK